MADDRSYGQLRRQFGEILRRDQQRTRQFQRALLTLHLLLVLGAPVYVWLRNEVIHETVGVFFMEALFVLWLLLWASLLLHVATVVFLTRSRVAETVYESLLLMASQEGKPEAVSRLMDKRKRDQSDFDEGFYTEDDEPAFMSRR